jgi:hypothetical protein
MTLIEEAVNKGVGKRRRELEREMNAKLERELTAALDQRVNESSLRRHHAVRLPR